MTFTWKDIFFNNYLIMVSVVSWMAAQILKTITEVVVNRNLSFERLWGSGGMPSSHSSLVCALFIGAAKQYGTDSPIFAIALVFALVVMYDAMGVRLETGKQARLINLIIKDFLSDTHEMSNEKKLKELVGHTPLQVLGGALLGILIALLVPVF